MSSQASDCMIAVVQSICEAVNSPRSLAAWLCLKYDHKAYLDLEAVNMHRSSGVVLLDYLVSEALRKYKGLQTGIDTQAVAIDGWKAAECRCLETNRTIKEKWLRGEISSRAQELLFKAQRKIATILGPLNESKVLDMCVWGPGATFDVSRRDATPAKKSSIKITCTGAALPYIRRVLEADPHWFGAIAGVVPEGPYRVLPSEVFDVVPGNRLITVPKSAKTDRVIAIEPTGNSFLQQGVRRFLRTRLARFGIKLDDQTINQQLARFANEYELSTLDLSAASDTISRELVASLLPIDWFLFLDALRSPQTKMPGDGGEFVYLHKFASMGNAFCFELETLLFYALSWACQSDEDQLLVFVYGDDIIVPRVSYDEVCSILHEVGFLVNPSKSYKEGPFFESCGKHYHDGNDITPFYQKETLSSPSELVRAFNRIVRFERRTATSFPSQRRRIWKMYPFRIYPRVPFGYEGDDGFLVPPEKLPQDAHGDFITTVLVPKSQFREEPDAGALAYKLRCPQYLNGHPRGWSLSQVGQGYASKRRIVHASSLLG